MDFMVPNIKGNMVALKDVMVPKFYGMFHRVHIPSLNVISDHFGIKP